MMHFCCGSKNQNFWEGKLKGIRLTSTLWLFNIAMGNGPFIDGSPIKNGDFPWLSC
jgi:hypothetical protein